MLTGIISKEDLIEIIIKKRGESWGTDIEIIEMRVLDDFHIDITFRDKT